MRIVRIYYLGTIDQYNRHQATDDDESNSCRSMLHNFGDNKMFMSDFDDQDSAHSFSIDTASLRGLAATINEDGSRGNVTEAERLNRFRLLWIPLVDQFIDKWGLHKVPLDIRQAIADVRIHLGRAPVLWPAMLYVEAEVEEEARVGTEITVPLNTDEYGMPVVVPAAPSDNNP